MGAIPVPELCGQCKHFEGYVRDLPVINDREPWEELRCVAYPEGIPETIIEGRVSHREPYAGDHGIQFEAMT